MLEGGESYEMALLSRLSDNLPGAAMAILAVVLLLIINARGHREWRDYAARENAAFRESLSELTAHHRDAVAELGVQMRDLVVKIERALERVAARIDRLAERARGADKQ